MKYFIENCAVMKMKKLIFFLMLISTQAVLSQWEATNWKSDFYIFRTLSAENFVVLEKNSNTLSISNDYGKSFLTDISGLSNDIRIECIAVQDSIVFIGTDSGLFSSSDYGYSWINKIDGFQYYNWINFIAVIDDYLFINLGYDGILLSSDKGDSWESVNNDFDVFDICSFFAIGNNLVIITDECQKMLVSTDLGQTWIEKFEGPEPFLEFYEYAVNDSTLYVLSKSDFNDGYQFRFYYSSDLGTTWETKPFSLDSSDKINDFAIIGDRIIICTDYIIYYSDDFGDSWVKSSLIDNGDRGAKHFSVSKDIIYATSGTEFYYSSDSGENWIPRLNSLNYGKVNSIYLYEDKIYVCTTPVEFCTTFEDGLYVSSDGGNSWERRGLKGITVNTVTVYDNKLFAGTENGLYISSDDGITWKEQIFGPYYDARIKKFIIVNDVIYVFASKNIYFSTTNGNDWEKLTHNTPFESSDIILSSYIKDNVFILGLTRGVYISTDYGKTWEEKINGLPVPELYSSQLNVKSIVYDGNSILIGTNYGIYKSTDLGENWVSKNNGIPKEDEKYYLILSMLEIKNYLVIGTTYGGIYYSSDEGETWVDTYCEIKYLNTIAVNEDYIFAGSWCNFTSVVIAELHKAKLSDLGITSVKDYLQTSGMIVSPNPAGDYITIQFGNKELQLFATRDKVQIFDVLGF